MSYNACKMLTPKIHILQFVDLSQMGAIKYFEKIPEFKLSPGIRKN
jgi:hypothetical protein